MCEERRCHISKQTERQPLESTLDGGITSIVRGNRV